MIAEGDELFRAQNFHSALQKYKLAASTAPDLAEAFWRKGHALVATHNYDLATTAFKRAIALTEDLGRRFPAKRHLCGRDDDQDPTSGIAGRMGHQPPQLVRSVLFARSVLEL